MKLICYSKILFLITALFTSIYANQNPSVAIYYGNQPNDQLMQGYDWIVVDADQIDPIWTRRYPNKLFAYVSVGEFESWRHKDEQIDKKWLLKNNDAWNSKIADLKNKKYREFLLKKIRKLHNLGYDNFFLDTLDSIFGIKMNEKERLKQKEALKNIIKEIRARFPDAKLIANRGVEVMETLCKSVNAFAIESLYKGIDVKNKSYIDVNQNDAKWIRTQLDKASNCALIPIVIDYVSVYDRKTRIEIARKIKADGYVPVISDIYLKYFSSSEKEMIKREVLILYDSTNLKDGDKVYSGAHLLASMPLEYMGYIPVLKDMKNGLPIFDPNRYAGVIVWTDRYATNQKEFFNWIVHLIENKQKILFINDFGFRMNGKRAKKLALEFKNSPPSSSLYAKVTYKDKIVGFELPPLVDKTPYTLKAKEAEILIKAETSSKYLFDAAAITSWGGYGIGGCLVRDIDNEPMWSVDPFKLFKKALRLPAIPAPDPTTQNGRRNLFIHIDGDGFVEKTVFNPKKYASQILLEDVLRRYPLPHSISVIEAEIAKNGLYAKISSKMRKVAKKIFLLPYVEPASHSFSHPFKWQKLINENIDKKLERSYHLPIKNYRFSLKREIPGSIKYINEKLLEKSYKKCSLFFWTGDCLPSEEALRMCETNGIKSINGGDTTATKENPWLGRIAPFALQRGSFWQIYVATQNENIYTNDWRGPFWGYQKAVETFAITNEPKRLKPINIYYHFYSASKKPSLEALHKVYRWALEQKTIPIFTSEYIDIAHDFYKTVLFKKDNKFIIKNGGYLRTLRISEKDGYPDIQRSKGVIGFWDEKDRRYIHLDNKNEHTLILSPQKPSTPYLMNSNAKTVSFYKDEKSIVFKLRSYVKLKAIFHTNNSWKIVSKIDKYSISKKGERIEINAGANDVIEVKFVKTK